MNYYNFKIADIKRYLFEYDTFTLDQYNWVKSLKSAGCTLCQNCNDNILSRRLFLLIFGFIFIWVKILLKRWSLFHT